MLYKKILTHRAVAVCLLVSLLVQPAARGGTASQNDVFGGPDLSFLFIAGILGLGSSPDNWVKQDLIQSLNALTPVIVTDCQSETGLPGFVEFRMPENSTISSVGQAIQVMSVETASNSESSHLIAGGLPEAALVHKSNGSSLILTDHDSPLCQQQAIPELLKVPRLDLTASQSFRQHSEAAAMVHGSHQSYRPQLFIDIDEKGYVVFVVVELVHGQLPRVRVIKTQMVAMEASVHEFLKQLARYGNTVIIPVGQMLAFYFNDTNLMSMQLMDLPPEASDQEDIEYNHLETSIGPILCIGNGGIFSGEFAGIQCPSKRNKAGNKGGGGDEDEEKSPKCSRYDPPPGCFGPKVPDGYKHPDEDEVSSIGAEPKRKPGVRKLTLKEWQEKQGSGHSHRDDLDYLHEIRSQVEAKALAEAALAHLTEEALDSDRDLREFFELQRHFRFINAMLSAHSDEKCRQLISEEIKAMRESRGYTRNITPFWWWTVSIFEQTHLAHQAAQFMQGILEIMPEDSDLAHALIWHMVHNGDADRARVQIRQWETRQLFNSRVISDTLQMTNASNSRRIQRTPYSDFEPLSQLMKQKKEAKRKEHDHRRGSERRKDKRRSEHSKR